MPTHRKVSCYGSPNSSKKAGFTTRSYNTVCYMCEGRSVKIMEGEDCFRRGLSYGFKLPFQSCKTVFCVGKNGTYQKKNSSPSVFFRARTVLVRLPWRMFGCISIIQKLGVKNNDLAKQRFV